MALDATTTKPKDILLLLCFFGCLLSPYTALGNSHMPAQEYEQVLKFWFGVQEDGFPIENKSQLWFSGSAEADRIIQSRFGSYIEKALAGNMESWKSTPRGQLALIILLDQFTRSIYRKTPQAFSGDSLAREIAHENIKKGWNKDLSFSERTFIYMPFMHSEELADQELCIELFNELKNEVPDNRKEQIKNSIYFAKDHRDIIARFGRFPHRNKTLRRESTPAERAYLEDGANSYGQ